MENIWFYIILGLNHVLDLSAYDHILFLVALSLPFTFKSWKKILVLVSVFTLAHCLSLGLSVYEIVVMDTGLIEFFIPITILFTALLNLIFVFFKPESPIDANAIFGFIISILFTTFFGLIHGFGFSNYFKILMSGEEEKLSPLLGFAAGIELSQLLIILAVLSLGYILQSIFKLKQDFFIKITSILVILITIPMLVATFPW
ncbi:MAG: HupE/UreJ family protein [Maribacter sp.]|uniref:HupE/UreJ family protein n=1 Tax=Maribacter sp. TaxID=1897614 RepID=UPI003C72AD65